MRPAFVGVYVVGEREDRVLEAAVPLQRDLHVPDVFLPFEVEDGLVDGVLGVVDVLDEVPYTALVLISDVPVLFTLVHEPIFRPLFRKADSRKRRLNVSNERSTVSVKTSGSGM